MKDGKKYKFGYIVFFLLSLAILIVSITHSIKLLYNENINLEIYVNALLCLIGGIIGLGCIIFVLLLYISRRKNKWV